MDWDVAHDVHNDGQTMKMLKFLLHEFYSGINLKMDQILDKIEKQQEDNKLLQEKVKRLTEEVEKHTKEITEINIKQQTKTYSTALKENIKIPTETTETHKVLNTAIHDRGIRRNNIIISGLKIGLEDPLIFIQAFLSARFNTRPDCVLAVQKLKSTNDERYLTTMKSAWEAQIVYSRRLQVLRNDNIYISEDLTAHEARIFFHSRQLKKKGVIHTTWTKEGKVYIRKSVTTEPEEYTEKHPLYTADGTIRPIQDTEQETQTSKSESSLDRLKNLNSTVEPNVNNQNKIFNTAGETIPMKRTTRKNTQDQQKNGNN